MSQSKLKIRKVHLNSFIEILMDLYNKGVNYVDLAAALHDNQDVVGISFCREYMDKDFVQNFDGIPESDSINKNISDEDLNQLI